MPDTIVAEPAVIATEFWASDDGKGVIAGLRLDRGLAHFLATHPAFADYGDDEWQAFYTDSGNYGDIRNAALDGWPS